MVDSDLMMDSDLTVDVNSLVDVNLIVGANLGILKVLVNLIRKISPSYATLSTVSFRNCSLMVDASLIVGANLRSLDHHLVEFSLLHSVLPQSPPLDYYVLSTVSFQNYDLNAEC